MEVKLVARTLEVFELYGQEGAPLSLTELARGLDAPMSSTLTLVRTLTKKGYLYETRKRGGYYPTRKMLGLCQQIDTTDPLLNLLHPHLVALRDVTGETTVLGKRQELSTIYLDAVESSQAIRYTAAAGQKRPLHANSIGKALLSVMPDDEVQRLAEGFEFKRITPQTIVTPALLIADLNITRTRGWASNISETFADLAAVAMPFRLNDEWYGVSVVGPLLRMRESWDEHIVALRRCVGEMEAAITTEVQ